MNAGIRSRGRRGSTVVPNWRWEDSSIDPYELKIAGWLASHTDSWRGEHVGRNEIAARTGISRAKVSAALDKLVELDIIAITAGGGRGPDGGRIERFQIEFDFDAWERDPRTPHVLETSDPRTPHVLSKDATRPSLEDAHLSSPETPQRKTVPEEPTDEFLDGICAVYPKKAGKYPAFRRWWALSEENKLKALEGMGPWLADYRATHTVKGKVEYQYLPTLGNWLRDRSWTDPAASGQPSLSARPPRPLIL